MSGGNSNGFALVVALLMTLMLSVLGAAFALVTSSEAMIALNFRRSLEAQAAAESALELAMADLQRLPDWSLAVNGVVQSSVIDGSPSGTRVLLDSSRLDLDRLVNDANCHKVSPCSLEEMDAISEERPWGSNNPRWKPFLYGPLDAAAPGAAVESPHYVVVLVADAPAEAGKNRSSHRERAAPGVRLLVLRAFAFGPRGARTAFDATFWRTPAGHVRVVAWRPS